MGEENAILKIYNHCKLSIRQCSMCPRQIVTHMLVDQCVIYYSMFWQYGLNNNMNENIVCTATLTFFFFFFFFLGGGGLEGATETLCIQETSKRVF